MAGFPEDGIRTLHEGRNHFWFQHRNEVITRALREAMGGEDARVLELGCGGFAIGSHLRARGFDVTASDRDRDFLRYLTPGTPSLVFDLTQDLVPTEAASAFDIVLLGDVIEHLTDPVGALRRARQFLRPGGRIIITVPALQTLWSDYDVQSMHEKRYDPKMLRGELQDAGFVVDQISFFMFIPSIILFFQRKLVLRKDPSRLGKDSLRISPATNAFMRLVMQIENYLLRLFPVPFGSSLLAVGKRSKESWENHSLILKPKSFFEDSR